MKVTLLTAASKDYWPLLALSSPNKLEYCIRHGIQLSMAVHDSDLLGCSGNWAEREYFMLDALNSFGCDWLWFMGADTLITNMHTDIRTLCDPEYDLIIGQDINGINNDSFLLKNSKASHDFLKRVLSRRDKQTDQCAMKAEMDHPSMRTSKVSQRLFNSFLYGEYDYGAWPEGEWQDGDLVLHLPAMSNQRRVELMFEYNQRIVR